MAKVTDRSGVAVDGGHRLGRECSCCVCGVAVQRRCLLRTSPCPSLHLLGWPGVNSIELYVVYAESRT